MQINFSEARAQRSGQFPRALHAHGCLDRRGQGAAVLLGQLEGAARIRVLVPAAAGEEKRCSAGILILQISLRITRVIPAKLIKRQRGVVAGVAKKYGARLAAGVHGAEHWHIVVHGPVGIGAVLIASFGRQSAVHGKTAARVAVKQPSRGAIGQSGADQPEQLLFERRAITLDERRGFELAVIRRRAANAEFRAAMRVRSIQKEKLRRQLPGFPDLAFQVFAQCARHADEIDSDDH